MKVTEKKKQMLIFIGSDHAGYTLKCFLVDYMQTNTDHIVVDVGCTSNVVSCDYPDIAKCVTEQFMISDIDNSLCVLLCGSGQGMSMAANKYGSVIRSGVAWNAEIASLLRKHNHANVLCLPARFVTEQESIDILQTFINTLPEQDERHIRRLNKVQ